MKEVKSMDKISALITVKYVVLYSTVAKIMFNDFNCTTQRKICCTSEVNIKKIPPRLAL